MTLFKTVTICSTKSTLSWAKPNLRQNMGFPFKNSFWNVSIDFVNLCKFELFPLFSFLSFSAENVENRLETIAKHFEKVAYDTGIVKTTGGSVGILGAGMAIAGLVFAPVTFGSSIGLTIAGAATGAAGGLTSLTGNIVQHFNNKADQEEAKKEMDDFMKWEKIVNTEFKKLETRMKKLGEYKNKEIVLNAIKDIGMAIHQGYNLTRGTYQAINGVKAAKNIAEFIQADFYAMQGIAIGMASPGLKVFGKAFITAGSTAAKTLTSVFAAVGIIGGIWDIYDGVKNIQSSEYAEALRESASKIKGRTNTFKDMLQALSDWQGTVFNIVQVW